MLQYVKQRMASRGKLYKLVKANRLTDLVYKYEIQKIKRYITTPFDSGLVASLHGSFWWRTVKQNKYTINDYSSIKSINLGVEWEFWGSPTQSQIKKFNLYREYYTDMWEVAFFKKDIPPTIEGINGFLEEVKLKMLKIKKEVRGCKISTHPLKIDSTGLVFNGIHIHMSVNTEKYFHSIERTGEIFSNINVHALILDKLNKLPSYRCINSHHLWGAYKSWEFNYKRKGKFKYIHFTPYSTIELRAVDTEDLIYKSRRLKISKILMNILQEKYSIYTELPELGNGDNLRDVARLCKQFLNTTTQKVVEDREDFIRIKSNYRYINMYLDENRIEIQ